MTDDRIREIEALCDGGRGVASVAARAAALPEVLSALVETRDLLAKRDRQIRLMDRGVLAGRRGDKWSCGMFHTAYLVSDVEFFKAYRPQPATTEADAYEVCHADMTAAGLLPEGVRP